MTVPGPDDQWERLKSWARDSDAKNEGKRFKRLRTLEEAKEAVDFAVHGTLAWIVPGSIILAFLLFWIGVIIYAVHALTPWHWLSPDQQKELHTFLFSSAVGAVVSTGSKKYIGKSKEEI